MDYDSQGRLLRLEAVYLPEEASQRAIVNAPYSYEAFNARFDWEALRLLPLTVAQPYAPNTSDPAAVSFDTPRDYFLLAARATADNPRVPMGAVAAIRWSPVYDAIEGIAFYPHAAGLGR